MRVFIQNEAGSFVKHVHNEKTLELKGTTEVSRAYPFPYGFVLETTAEDGLNVDCFVLTKTALRTGQIIECDAVGLMEQIEDGKEDHNVLGVIRGEGEGLERKTKEALVEFVSHVFDHVASKRIRAGNFLGRREALDYIAKHRDPTTLEGAC
jgi:inorganic pyrophosphatase